MVDTVSCIKAFEVALDMLVEDNLDMAPVAAMELRVFNSWEATILKHVICMRFELLDKDCSNKNNAVENEDVVGPM